MTDDIRLGRYRLHPGVMQPVLTPIGQLKEHPKNPRRGDTDAIGESMQANGIYRPVFAQKSTGHILAGNHTYKSIREGGGGEAPVVWLDVDDEEALRILLADNRTADLGGYDDAVLRDVLLELDDFTGTGYTDEDLQELADALDDRDDNDLPTTGEMLALADVTFGEPETEVHRHEVWTVGRHVLVIAKLTDEHHLWAGFLEEDVRFCPYPEPYLTCSDMAEEHRLLLVQPNLFLAGHLLDKHKSTHPGDVVEVQA